MGERLDMIHQSALTAQKAKRVIGFIQTSMDCRARDVIFPLSSIPVRPYLKSCVHFWSPQHRKDTDLLEQTQRRATKMTKQLKNPS